MSNPHFHRKVRNGSARGRANSATSGARDGQGQQIPYHEDPVRNRSSAYLPNGYLSPGYDSGRSK